jgi:hypothetical protein
MVLDHRHGKEINTVLTRKDQHADGDGGSLPMVLDHHETK